MLTITSAQLLAMEDQQKSAYIAKLRALLCEHPVVGAAAAARPPEWYRFAVERAAHHGLQDELDVAEFAAQLLARGDRWLDDRESIAALDHPENPAWLRLRHFARNEMLVDFGDD
jgi:hypothetical protein